MARDITGTSGQKGGMTVGPRIAVDCWGDLLPEDDQDLEELLDWLGENDRLFEFGLLMHAALIAGRKPDVDLVRRHPGDILRRDFQDYDAGNRGRWLLEVGGPGNDEQGGKE